MLPSLGQEFQDEYGVNIDYTKSIPAVFRDVTRVAILQHCNLETLGAIDDDYDSSRAVIANDWPSWVPRWDLDGGSIDLGGPSSNAHGFSFGYKRVLSGDHKVDRNLVLAYAATKGMQDCLPLRGYELDNVVAQLPTFHVASDAKGLQVEDLATFMSECFKFINTPTRLHLARELVATLFSISHLDRMVPRTNEECFRLLHFSANVLITGHIPEDANRPMLNTYHTLKPWLPEIFTNLGIHCNNKHFFLTKNDTIGGSGQEVAVGDLVVALFGATDVYLLRPVSPGGLAENRPGPTQGQGSVRTRGYTLLSRCFIHGITDGTEPLLMERMVTPPRVFEIW